LKHHRERDVTFDWDQALNFDGETGPYLQYTHARICGILRKSGRPAPESADWSLLAEPETRELLKALARFPEAVEKAGAENEPSLVTNCLFDLTKVFNVFYNTHRVIGSGGAKEEARLLLADSVRQVLQNGLTLLGIKPLAQM